MNKESITDKQAISMVALFICGSTFMFDTAQAAKEDIWFALILAVLAAFVMVRVYGRILFLFPNKDIFDICIHIFGKWIGRLLCILYAFFGIHLASLVLYDYAQFMGIVALSETPEIISMICIMFLIVWMMKEGIVVLGRWCEFFIVIILFLVFITMPLFIPNMDINNLRPFLKSGMSPILDGAIASFTFPFAEPVIFLGVLDVLKERKSPYKVYSIGLALGALIVCSSAIDHMLVLGPDQMRRTYFPPYYAYQLINIKNFITRLEIVIAAGFLIGGLVKITVCLLACCKGICKICSQTDYKTIVTPVGIITIIMAAANHSSIMDLLEWTISIWRWYAIFFQIILPIIILIAAEVKTRRGKKPLMS